MAGLNAAPRLGTPRAFPVGAAPEQLCEANDGRTFLGLFNTGANTIYVGFSNAMTQDASVPISAGASFMPPVAPGDQIWAMAGAGNAGTLLVLEG